MSPLQVPAAAANPYSPLLKKRPRDYSEHVTRLQSSMRTKADEVEAGLRWELHGNVHTNQPEFLDTLFDIDASKVSQIFQELQNPSDVKAKTFYETDRWVDFPEKVAYEKYYYAPFVALANRIVELCEGDAKQPLRWISDSSKAPKSNDTTAALLKPDIVGALNVPEAQSNVREGPVAPWRRILVPIEVKKAQSPAAALLQVLKYTRQVLRESPDRRFVFGLTLAHRKVCVYLADRSGVLGCKSFDIHDVSFRKHFLSFE